MKILSTQWRGVVCCPNCGCMLELEKKDIKHDAFSGFRSFRCIGCKKNIGIKPDPEPDRDRNDVVFVHPGWLPK